VLQKTITRLSHVFKSFKYIIPLVCLQVNY